MKYLICLFFVVLQLSAFSQTKITVKPSGTTVASNGAASFAVYNIQSWGAVGDNVTINTSYIQLALNAAHLAGGTVYVPAGIFLTGKLTSYANVTIRGEGYLNSILRSYNSDTMIVVRNAVNNITTNYLSNSLIENIKLDGNNLGIVGLFMDGCANFTMSMTYFNEFNNQNLVLKNCLVGTIEKCKFTGAITGLLSYPGGGNVNATTLIAVNDCVFNYHSKWAIDCSGGGQLQVNNIDMENNGVSTDTLSGGIYYHANQWPGGLRLNGGWAEQNLGTVIYIDGNVTAGSNYPATTTHSISAFQDLGQQYGFTKRNIAIRGSNQRLGIVNSTITGSINNVIADGTNNIVTVLNSTFDAANTNLTRNGATIVTK